jgi:putative peptidoglycan lipid II flippase
MFRVAGFVAFLTIISKILGLARDLLVAQYFGTSMEADAFNLAYLLTGNFFIILGGVGGPFYSSLVAILPKLQSQNFNINHYLKDLVKQVTIGSIFITLVLFFSKDLILSMFIDKDMQPDYFAQTLLNIDILLPLVVLTAPIGILFAAGNCLKKYFSPSLSPGFINVILIAVVIMMGDGYNGLALAIGTSIGSIVSFVIQIPFSFQKNIENLIELSKEKLQLYKKEFYILLIPALISASSTQLMVFIDSYFCKYLQEGSWTAITLANRLVQMPLGVVLTAFLVPVFPKISEMVEAKRFSRIKEVLIKSQVVLLLISLPGIVLGMLYPREIIALIFERGAFDANSTALVAEVFFYLCLSSVPYIFRDSFTRTLYCFGDSKSSLYVMILAIILKFILNLFLVKSYGVAGIAIATVLTSCFNAGCLFLILRKKFRQSVIT